MSPSFNFPFTICNFITLLQYIYQMNILNMKVTLIILLNSEGSIFIIFYSKWATSPSTKKSFKRSDSSTMVTRIVPPGSQKIKVRNWERMWKNKKDSISKACLFWKTHSQLFSTTWKRTKARSRDRLQMPIESSEMCMVVSKQFWRNGLFNSK